MKCISLSIPFHVLSTKINRMGEMETHVLTPFGDFDISFRLARQGPSRRAHYEVEVEGDIEHWVLEGGLLMEEFRKSLLDYIRGISRECFECFRDDAAMRDVHFKGSNFNVKASWREETIDGPGQAPAKRRVKEISP